ncbi:unnamed protein product [Arabidopsis lyrata]|uniref:Protease inhibitor/seed storage/lipid transfer protein family protein n=1 Tax=Arabidopsis lyrata subsp. lyrata TaxID=81972 RepID=D7MUC6_ARALL|nr:2S seed storage protein 5 [Arabidopsis lyrata subsp. lyrata]EFH42316.1 protease inhibitor/seed storage/lipid transfer protein family protein [Arabidopsis lyrata subsp. lyrata]CAH8279685.1 unnamed protein product [Arabidopsis lyrata]|eukprot:XP_002866057.1 2S seed storage protein 5 [Arabidopsis lyrata subsp. lyrata]
MAKLILVFATLALFILLANASIYRAVVEFDEEDDVSNPQQDKCQREFMQHQQLRGCKQWIRKRAQQGRIGYEADDFELTLDVDFEDDENPTPQQHQPALRMCCNELRQVDKMCVCPTLKKAAQQVRFQGMHGQQQMKHVFQTAQNLPKICKIPAVESCQFKASPY